MKKREHPNIARQTKKNLRNFAPESTDQVLIFHKFVENGRIYTSPTVA